MIVCIIAPGSRGDVQPYVALGKGLLEAGHVVRLVTHEDFRSLASANGLEFWPVAGSVQAIAQSVAMRERMEGGSFVSLIAQMAKEAKDGAVALTRVALAASAGVDLVLAGLGGLFTGLAVAQRLDKPFVQAHYIPLTPTKAYPSFLLPDAPAGPGGLLNRLTYHLARQVLWQGFRAADRLARSDVLGLPAAPFLGPYGSERLQGAPVLYGYSQAVIPRPSDWPDHCQVTGYWFLDEDADWSPPPALEAFLRAGPPPVYVGFGSMSSRNPQETAALVLQALDYCRLRAIMLSGWDGLSPDRLPDTVMMVDSVPFSWLFPRVCAVVHHGGAGTTSAGLRAGVPGVIVPFFGDQPYWGKRVADLGVGPKAVPRRSLTAERLAHAMERAATDGEMRSRAAALGAEIRAEDGVGRAVELLEQAMQ